MFLQAQGYVDISPKIPLNAKYDSIIGDIEQCIRKMRMAINLNSKLPFKDCPAYHILKKLSHPEKVEFLLHLAVRLNVLENAVSKYDVCPPHDPYETTCDIGNNLLNAFMCTRIDFPRNFSFQELYDLFYKKDDDKYKIFLTFRPFGRLVTQIEKHIKHHGLTDQLEQDIDFILNHPAVAKFLQVGFEDHNLGPDIGKAAKKLQQLQQVAASETLPDYELGSGRFGILVKEDLQSSLTEQQVQWHQLFHHLSGASSSKPGKKFITIAMLLIDAIGSRDFKNRVNKWLLATVNLDISKQPHTYINDGHTDTYYTIEYIEPNSFNLIKGLLWSMSRFHDKQSLQIIARLTEKCFLKIPGVGPAAAGVGNAGIYTLAQSKGITGISHLSRLKLRIRQNNTQKLIQKFIDEQAKKKGIKPAQIEEIAAADFGLCNGELIETFDAYQLHLRLTGIGRLEQQWLKPNGEAQKSVPAFVKENTKLSAKLKQTRDLIKQIKQASTAQRDRIDRLYTDNMSWTLADFKKYYLHHGLVSQIAKKLIWNLDQQAAFFYEGQWQNELGEVVAVHEACTVRLWHPMDSELETILAWRERLEILQIKQPLKQAYREIYLLTDAEIKTRTYSNRMAAHLLKQHQFNSLASLRGWKYSLLGSYDDGRYGEIASRELSEHGVTAQFQINEMGDDSDFNDAGIWHYVATDQVCFTDGQEQPVPLVEIPPLIFSEMMRDVDLFVGVASVANDPQWQDGGPDARQNYRDYWRRYSFGELGEMAKTRKSVLEHLLPRLKIRDVARIEGRFLVVEGRINTYKIHIGSSNILIAPTDRYLCIVPGRGNDKNLQQVFLPFDGDNGLSIVLSKAFLLAEDDKIKDKTIISQL